MTRWANRQDAGRELARNLQHLRGQDLVVLGLPRGGVPVAYEVAHALGAPLDVIVVRKLGLPFQPEVAMGAIGETDVRFLDDRTIGLARVSAEQLRAVEQHERAVLEALVARLRDGRPRLALDGRVAVVVDDGIATGSTARAACQVARHLGAARVVLAAPVAPASVTSQGLLADELVCSTRPRGFQAVGDYYRDFAPVPDDEVAALLQDRSVPPPPLATDVRIPVGDVVLDGRLEVPADAGGVVLFAHGSGSSRHSPRNQLVARELRRAGLATLLLDLLTPDEQDDRRRVFDIPLLGERLGTAGRWLLARPEAVPTSLGYFGASTGSAAALWAAGHRDPAVRAVVSRGGRPDLTGDWLAQVDAPTLLIVGGADPTVLQLNRDAQQQLTAENQLVVVPGATHLFEEPGALERVARLAAGWFGRYLLDPARASATGAVR